MIPFIVPGEHGANGHATGMTYRVTFVASGLLVIALYLQKQACFVPAPVDQLKGCLQRAEGASAQL